MLSMVGQCDHVTVMHGDQPCPNGQVQTSGLLRSSTRWWRSATDLCRRSSKQTHHLITWQWGCLL